MSDVQVLLLGPNGKAASAVMAVHLPATALHGVIAKALGLPGGVSLRIRREDGSLVDQSFSLAQWGIRTGDRVIIEVDETGRPGLLDKVLGRTAKRADTVLPSAYRVLPCYLVIDTSKSMAGGPIGQINTELPRLRLSMLREPELAEICQLCLIVFDGTARVAAPLTDVSVADFPLLTALGNTTNYARPFELLREIIAADLYELYRSGRRPYRPVVFFLSDGQHNQSDDWSKALKTLTDRSSFHGAPNMIAFGFGQAIAEVVAEIGQRAAYMPDEGLPSVHLDTFMTFLLSSLTNSLTNVRRDQNDVFVVPPAPPKGWRVIRIPS